MHTLTIISIIAVAYDLDQYGTERSYDGLRLARRLAKRQGEEVHVFLIGDAASYAKRNQKVPPDYYNHRSIMQELGDWTLWADRVLTF